jgi:hypothetical protein
MKSEHAMIAIIASTVIGKTYTVPQYLPKDRAKEILSTKASLSCVDQLECLLC